jgi:sarcosine oxidase subunit beta
VGRRFGVPIAIRARKGHIVVGVKAPGFIRRKMMEAGYTGTVESSDERLQVAMVAEIARSGTLLLGSSRQITGYDTRVDPYVADAIARRAARFFPALRGMKAVRTYAGLRPFSPDHLPLIGPIGPPGLYVASGHEGAGICESPATGLLISQWVTGQPTELPGDWYDPRRFADGSGVQSPTSKGVATS